jgi:formimidoylglutamate deiminase
MSEVFEADLTWLDGRFQPNVRVAVGPDGRIERIGALPERPTRRLSGRALLPGFVNVHSHAFQRGLRGRGQSFPAGQGDFWSWRESMYALVDDMDAGRLHALSLQAFREMLAAGITTVGEFHYLHHDRSLAGHALDRAVLDAAREAGIRIVLLQAYYRTGGVGKPLAGAQRRFHTADPADYWRQFDRLAAELDPRRESMGAVVHSIRAAALDDLVAVHAEAARRGLVFHMHVEETARELEECRAHHGRTPMRILLDELELDARFTAVHGTQTTPGELAAFLATGATLCVCPTTEGNLGDGIARLARAGEAAFEGHLALGSDSNERLSMLEEMRWLEFAQRLGSERRGCLRDARGDVARVLVDAATRNGARALGLEAGELRPGALADLVAVDLGAPALAGATEAGLAAALVFGCGDDVIRGVAVGGRWVRGPD